MNYADMTRDQQQEVLDQDVKLISDAEVIALSEEYMAKMGNPDAPFIAGSETYSMRQMIEEMKKKSEVGEEFLRIYKMGLALSRRVRLKGETDE